jgi:hypothetical protein
VNTLMDNPATCENPYPDGSHVYTRYPLPGQEENREYWAWMPGTVAERCAPDEWLIFMEHPAAAEFDEEGELYYPSVFRDSSEISPGMPA